MPLYTLHRARSPPPSTTCPSVTFLITLHPPHTTTTCTFTTFACEAPKYTKSYAEFVRRITNSEEYKQMLAVWTSYPEVAHVEVEGVEVLGDCELCERLREVLGHPVGEQGKGVRVDVWVREGGSTGSGLVGWIAGKGVELSWLGL